MRAARKILTHLGALAAGLLLATRLPVPAAWRTGQAPGLLHQAESGKGRPLRTLGGAGVEGKNDAERNRQAFRNSWREVSTRRITRKERLALQEELLKRWAAEDLEGALIEVAAEDWDSLVELSEVFEEAFRKQPEEAWRLIATDATLGLSARRLRSCWIGFLAEKQPARVIGKVPDLPPSQQLEAIRLVFSRDPAAAEGARLMEALAAAGKDGRQADGWLQAALEGSGEVDLTELRQRWQGMAGPARRVALVAWAGGLQRRSPGDFAAEWEGIAPANRQEAVRTALDVLDWSSPAMIPLLDRAVAAGEWEAILANEAGKPRDYENYLRNLLWSRSLPDRSEKRVEIQDWALTLPERPETVEIYQMAIENVLRSREEKVIPWLERLPEGDWHREQGFSALAQQALLRGDVELVEKAIAGITDPALKAEAQGNWDRARGR